jgi:MerR family transcriptional regulator/heat shock protein HspR
MKRRKGFYSISVVAKMFSVHQQTIRMYEKEGLISPKRTEGNTRLFSEEDVDRLEKVIHLTHKMGVNLAGVQMILKLQKKVERMQHEMNKLFEQMQGNLEKESEQYKQDIKEQGEQLIAMKKDGAKKMKGIVEVESDALRQTPDYTKEATTDRQDESDDDSDDWEIDYD